MLIGVTILGSRTEGQVCRCESLDNSHNCAIKWLTYESLIANWCQIFAGVVSGVSYLHAQDIVYREIKYNNIFLNDHGCAILMILGKVGIIAR